MTDNKAFSVVDAISAAVWSDIKFDPELEQLLPKMDDKAFAELKKSIEAEGIRDSIIIWREANTVVDGHNRGRIAKELGIVPPLRDISFKSKEDVKTWMIRNQLGRRNLTPTEFTYYIGELYNASKQYGKGPAHPTGDTAKAIADEHGVSERTVRRAAETAAGMNKLAAVRQKLQKIEEKPVTPVEAAKDYTQEELTQIGKSSTTTVAEKVVKAIDEEKQKAKASADAAKRAQASQAAKPTLYRAVFCEPQFAPVTGIFSAKMETKPHLEKDAIVYMIVPDEHLTDGLDLVTAWGLEYQCSIIFAGDETYDGTFSVISHTNLLIATKGIVPGPKKGNEAKSLQIVKGSPIDAMFKVADTYSPDGKRLNMRKTAHKGWENLK